MKISGSQNCSAMLQPDRSASSESTQVPEKRKYTFQIQCPVYLDKFYVCVYREGWNHKEKYYYSSGTPDKVLVLDIPHGDYCFQIFGKRFGKIVAGLYGKTADLTNGAILHLIPEKLIKKDFARDF